MSQEQLKILVVDDSDVLRRIVREALGVIECEVFEASDGKKGLLALAEHPMDLVILDWHMPEMDGLEMFFAMKEQEKLMSIPVIMLTAEDHKESMLTAIRSGVRHYLTKPFTHEDLLARVVQVLRLDQK